MPRVSESELERAIERVNACVAAETLKIGLRPKIESGFGLLLDMAQELQTARRVIREVLAHLKSIRESPEAMGTRDLYNLCEADDALRALLPENYHEQ